MAGIGGTLMTASTSLLPRRAGLRVGRHRGGVIGGTSVSGGRDDHRRSSARRSCRCCAAANLSSDPTGSPRHRLTIIWRSCSTGCVLQNRPFAACSTRKGCAASGASAHSTNASHRARFHTGRRGVYRLTTAAPIHSADYASAMAASFMALENRCNLFVSAYENFARISKIERNKQPHIVPASQPGSF